MKTVTKWLLYALFKFRVKTNIINILMTPIVVIPGLIGGMYGTTIVLAIIASIIAIVGERCYDQFFQEKDNGQSQ